jgi:Arc/MetJ family transcription regulator
MKDMHSTGQPDTPIEVLTDLLKQAIQETTLEGQKDLVQQALKIAAGLDDYLDKATSAPPEVGCFLPYLLIFVASLATLIEFSSLNTAPPVSDSTTYNDFLVHAGGAGVDCGFFRA